MTLMAMLLLGFFLGMRHATDSDHVVAVSAIVSRERTPSAGLKIGALWGLGHTATILIVGGAVVLFGWVIPPRIGLSLEMSVAVMLIALGAMNLSGALVRITKHEHGHSHAHGHAHGLRRSKARFTRRVAQRGFVKRELAPSRARLRGSLRPLVIGVVHGLAGSAAIALLVLSSIKSSGAALAYLAVFGVGTVLGMMLITLAISFPISLLSRRFENAEQLMARATGVLSVAFGLFLMYRIGIVDGLFFGATTWLPR